MECRRKRPLEGGEKPTRARKPMTVSRVRRATLRRVASEAAGSIEEEKGERGEVSLSAFDDNVRIFQRRCCGLHALYAHP